MRERVSVQVPPLRSVRTYEREVVAEGWRVVWNALGDRHESALFKTRVRAEVFGRQVPREWDARIVRVTVYRGAK